MVTIATVVPVLGRPDAIAPLIASWQIGSREPGRLIFVASPEDTLTVRMLRLLEPEHIICHFESGLGDFARKINLAYDLTDDEWIFQAADDVRFEDGWDTALLATAAETGALVVGSNDCMNPTVKAGRHSTHILFARSYCDDPGASLDGPGSVFSTVYGHQYVDNEAIGLAQRRGVWAFSAASRVVHQHPFWLPGGRRNLDATYRKGLSSSGQDARLWRQRQRLLLRSVP